MGLLERLKNVISPGSQRPEEQERYVCPQCGSEFDVSRQTCPECGSNDVERVRTPA